MLDCPTHQKKGLRIWEELGSGLLPVLGAHSPPPPPPQHPYSFGTSSWMRAMEGSAGSHLTTSHSYTHPHNIDSDQHIDGVIAGDPLEHAEVGVVSCLLGDIIRERHFVDTHGALM